MSKKKIVVERPEEAKSLADLKRIWGSCQRCSGCTDRKNVVLGAGPVPAPVMLIGQWPARDEDETGLPVRGMGGQYTYWALQLAEIPWEIVFFDNILACWVRNPNKTHKVACRPRLEDTIEIVKPRLIVAAGAEATMWFVGGKKGIDWTCRTKEHGGAVVYFTTHPMEPLRQKTPDTVDRSDAKIRREYAGLGALAREMRITEPKNE